MSGIADDAEAVRQRSMANPAASPGDSALCVACGLCCDGTLFGRMALREDDLPLARRGGAPVFTYEGELSTTLPCGFLDGATCTVYQSRYHICHKFRCSLLKRHGRGTIDRETALDRIAEARRLRDVVKEAAAAAGVDGPVETAREAVQAWHVGAATPSARAMAMVEFRLMALDTYLSRHFHNRDATMPAPSAPGAGAGA